MTNSYEILANGDLKLNTRAGLSEYVLEVFLTEERKQKILESIAAYKSTGADIDSLFGKTWDKQVLSTFYFDNTIIIGETLTDCSDLFSGCKNLDLRIILHDGITNCRNMFKGLHSVISSIKVPSSAKDCSGMFAGVTEFNGVIEFSEGNEDLSEAFKDCRDLRFDVVIPSTAKYCVRMFEGCWYFNDEVKLSSGIEDATEMFKDCFDLRKVTGDIRIKNCTGMFSNCRKLKSVGELKYGIVNGDRMFYHCEKLEKINNGYCNLPSTLETAVEMFQYCESLNTSFTIHDSLRDASRMFNGCKQLRAVSLEKYSDNVFNECETGAMFSGCDKLDSFTIESITCTLSPKSLRESYERDNCRIPYSLELALRMVKAGIKAGIIDVNSDFVVNRDDTDESSVKPYDSASNESPEKPYDSATDELVASLLETMVKPSDDSGSNGVTNLF